MDIKFFLNDTSWMSALSMSDLGLAEESQASLRLLGIQRASDLLNVIKNDRLFFEDNSVLVQRVCSELLEADIHSKTNLLQAFARLCNENKHRSIKEVALERRSTVGSVIEFARLSGIDVNADMAINPDAYCFAVDTSVSRANSTQNQPNTEEQDSYFSNIMSEVERSLQSRELCILKRRTALNPNRETLEAIGGDLGLTRERVRQIEKKAVRRLGVVASGLSLKEFLGVIAPIYFYVENSGGSATPSDIASALNVSQVTVSFVLELNRLRSPHHGLTLISNSGVHFPLKFDLPNRPDRPVLLSSFSSVDQEMITTMIGPSNVICGSEFVNKLGESIEPSKRLLKLNHSLIIDGLAKRGLLYVGDVNSSEETELVPWVIAPGTPRLIEVIQALIRAGSKSQSNSLVTDYSYERDGVISHEIIKHLDKDGGHRTAEHALNELCRRYDSIFVRTSPANWGLVGAGAEVNELAFEEKLAHGTTINALMQVFEESAGPLSFSDIVDAVRIIEPTVKEMSIRLYVNTLHADRFNCSNDGLYSLSSEYLERKNVTLPQGSTINLLLDVLAEAEFPLSLSEIVERCKRELSVDPGAIRSYLEQNYQGFFIKKDDGKYLFNDDQ